MRITFDTREDSYEDALAVLRRAYGRHVLVRKGEESSGPSVRVESNKRGAAKKSSRESTTGRSGREARKHPANGSRKSVSGKASATSGVVADSPTLSTARKAPGKKSVARRTPPAKGRLGAPRKRAAANTAPPGQSEAIRSWARAQGMQVSARGRMSAKVIAAYLDAHKE